MSFRTILPNLKSPLKISHNSRLLFLGSCFAENIGKKLSESLFDIHVNPVGIAYHPINILQHIEHSILLSPLEKEYVELSDQCIVHYDYHSSIQAESTEALHREISKYNEKLLNYIRRSQYIFISLGSAWGFYHKQLGRIIANCHKQDPRLFLRKLSTHQELVTCYTAIIEHINKINPKANIIFTVSPIRHLRYGMIENNQAKARLISALTECIDTYSSAHYFPSYELMMDDLRDYRFYTQDMLHPSPTAIDYIWDYFKEYYFEQKTIETCSKLDKLLKHLQHRPLSKDTVIIKNYQVSLTQKIQEFQSAHPDIDVESLYDLLTESISKSKS